MTPTDNIVYPGIPEEWLNEEDYTESDVLTDMDAADGPAISTEGIEVVEHPIGAITEAEWHTIIALISRDAHMMRLDLRSGKIGATQAMKIQVTLEEFDAMLVKVRAVAEYLFGKGTCEREIHHS